jgi:RNA 2',3'-cyclic 3'-phosphodiesterase
VAALLSRLFVAVLPPPEVLDQVAALERPAIEGLRWTPREQWHVTLRFLGEADAAPAAAALRGTGAARVRARLGPTVGRFDQRILHLPLSGLDDLARDVIAATAALGRPPDGRPFHGHLTLARVAKTATVDLRRLAGTPLEAEWDVEAFSLMESRLSPAGARYHLLERFEL